jgi:hypothetical protein
MSATAAASEHAALRSMGQTHRVLRRLGKSIGALFYLLSVGITAAWVIGVFFGLGLFLLTSRAERPASDWGSENSSSNLSTAESPWLIQALSRLDQLLPGQPAAPVPLVGYAAEAAPGDGGRPLDAPLKESGLNLERQPAPPAEAGTANAAVEPESRPLTPPAAVAEPTPVAAPPSQAPSEATGAPNTARRPHSGSHREHHPERTANTRLPQSHAPVQAIQELLQKHSGLLK